VYKIPGLSGLKTSKKSDMREIIFMVHGMWVGGWCWNNYKNYFENKGYQCITPTLPFHDVDPNMLPHSQLGTTSLLDYVAYLEMEIKKLDKTPIVIGHSMGGLLAQILASRGLSKACVLLAPGSPSDVFALEYIAVKSVSEIMFKWGFWRKPIRLSFEKAVYSMFNLMPLEEQRNIYNRMVSESGKALAEIAFGLKASEVDEKKIKCPLLVISGKKDRITPAKVVKKVAEKYNATYKEFKNHAHYVIGEPGWEEIAEYIYNWIDNYLYIH
jgi:pimeloyl-ACP methyl ester carboxylesterase